MTLRAATLNQMAAAPGLVDPADTFEAFYDATSPQAYGMAFFITENVEGAEAACEAAYFENWRTDSQPARESFTERQSRLMASVRKQCVTFCADSGAPQGSAQATPLRTTQEHRAIRAAYQGLPEEDRRAVTLVYFGGMNVAQAAATLTRPVADLRATLRHALLTLSTRLAL